MPDKAKIKTVEEWSTPCNTKEVQQFLGLDCYFRQSVSWFADITAPLHRLTQRKPSSAGLKNEMSHSSA